MGVEMSSRGAVCVGLLLWSVPASAEDCVPEHPGVCVHPDATVLTTGSLGDGTTVAAYAYVGPGAALGDGAFLAPRSRIEGTSGSSAEVAGPGLVLGRRAVLGFDVELGSDAAVGRSARIGDRTVAGYLLSAGYATTIGADGDIGNNVTLGSLVTLGDEVTIGDGAVLARGVSAGDRARVMGVVGPETQMGEGVCVGPTVRVRKGVTLSNGARILSGARIGRDAEIGAGAVVGRGAVVRAGAVLSAGAVVPEDGFVARGETFADTEGDPGSPVTCDPIVSTSSGLLHHSYDDPSRPLADSSPSGLDGSGSVGTADGHAVFNGSQSYTIPGTGGHDWSNGLSAAVWIRWYGSGGSYRGIITNGWSGTGNLDIRFGRESSGTRLGVRTRSTAGESRTVDILVPPNEWHHVAVVHGDDGVWTVYYDGQVYDVQSVSGPPRSEGNNLIIGNNTIGERYSGDLDEVRVYDYAITPAEVAALAAQVP